MKKSIMKKHLALAGVFLAACCIFTSTHPRVSKALEDRVVALEEAVQRLEELVSGMKDKSEDMKKTGIVIDDEDIVLPADEEIIARPADEEEDDIFDVGPLPTGRKRGKKGEKLRKMRKKRRQRKARSR